MLQPDCASIMAGEVAPDNGGVARAADVGYVQVVQSDFLIVGGGIAGASVGYFLTASGSVTVLEMESSPGYHSTGRTAALFSEYYGGPAVRALTAASRPFLTAPPAGFGTPLLTQRGVVALCPAGGADRFAAALASGLTAPTPARQISPDEVQRYCPAVRRDWYSAALLRPATMDIDVAALHQGFLRGIAAGGGHVVTSARLRGLAWRGGSWQAATDAGEFSAAVVVNASGAWADQVADLAGVRRIGLTPRRRTAFLVDAPRDADGMPVARWPMVTDVTESFYFKPDAGLLLISPADTTPVPPGDARPRDLDIAIAAARVEEATTLVIRHVRHAWAGLRSNVRDDVPVIGAAPGAPGFIWHAALSGYGIQTAPAAGALAAELAVSALAGSGPDGPGVPGINLSDIAPERVYDYPAGGPADTPALDTESDFP